MPPRRDVPDDTVNRWAELRATAAEADARLRARKLGPRVPVLDAIAWLSGLPEPEGDDRLRLLIERAREERYSWREIALAVGESGDRAGQSRVQSRQVKRNLRAQRQTSTTSAT